MQFELGRVDKDACTGRMVSQGAFTVDRNCLRRIDGYKGPPSSKLLI